MSFLTKSGKVGGNLSAAGAGLSLLTGSHAAIGILNPATGALVPGASGLAAATASLLTNPITIGAGALLAGTAIWVKSQGHRKADEWVKGYQNPWGDSATSFIDKLNASRSAGTLTHDDAIAAQRDFEANVADLWDKGGAFSALGKKQDTVIRQAHSTLDPLIEGWRQGIQGHIDALTPATESPSPSAKAPGPDPIAAQKANAAAEQQRKRALGMQGRQSTMLTGPMGLTNSPSGRRTTLLGYAA